MFGTLQSITRWCQQKLAPTLRYSQYEYRDELLPILAGKSNWLDIGCGHQLFAEWMREDQIKAFSSCEISYGIDLDFEGMKKHPDLKNKCMASGYNLPFRDGSMDVISANMVMEHVEEPGRLLQEVRRVLRKSGIFIFHTPNRRGYRTRAARLIRNQFLKNLLVKLLDGREEEDVFPAFYLLNDRESIRAAAAGNGFQVTSVKTVESSPLLSRWGPLAIPELLLIRVLQRPAFDDHRATVIALLQTQ